MKRMLFLGSKPIGYNCLKHLIEHYHQKSIAIIGVLSNDNPVFGTDSSVTQLAAKFDIPIIAKPDDMPETDILYSVQYHQILKQHHIDQAKQVALNLHMAPLPEYRGCNQFSFAIVDGKHTFGATIHKMDARIDHGDIAFEKRFVIPENCWVNELYDLTYTASLSLFQESIENIINSQIHFTPQSEYLEERGCSLHFRKEMKDLKIIDLNWDAEKIERHIRACSMPGFEAPYCFINGQKIYFEREGNNA